MTKPMVLSNSLHYGTLRIYSVPHGGWKWTQCALFNHVVAVSDESESISMESQASSGNTTSSVHWTDLFSIRAIDLIRHDDSGADSWRFTIVVNTEGNTGISTYRMEANTEEERKQWIRALLLAKKLLVNTEAPKPIDNTHQEAFVRYASSDCEDSDTESECSTTDSDSNKVSMTRGFGQLKYRPSINDKARDITSSTLLEISVVHPEGQCLSVSLSLSHAQREIMSIRQLKLNALQQLRAQAHVDDTNIESTFSSLPSPISSTHSSDLMSPSNSPNGSGSTLDSDFTPATWFRRYLHREADWFVLYIEDVSCWLQDEQQPINYYVPSISDLTSTLPPKLYAKLMPVNAMPFPAIQLKISSVTTKVSDISQRPFSSYVIDVSFNDMTWQVHRRFKEFYKMHTQLQQNLKASAQSTIHTLPVIPSKHVFTPLDGAFISKRKVELEQYLRALVSHPEVSHNVIVLSFLGVVSTASNIKPSKNIKNVIHITSLDQGLDYGDIILFSNRFSASILQRKVTRSRYDHVGIVVPDESRRSLRIMEATGEGIQVYSLKARLMAYAREVSKTIVVRKLSVERTHESRKRMIEFVMSVDGNPYSILGILHMHSKSDCPMDLGGDTKTSSVDETRQATTANGPVQTNGRRYFCSSLVASALKHMGWVETTRTSSYFWPGSFEDGGEIEQYMAKHVMIGPETMVDCRIVEVGLATTGNKTSPMV